VGSNVNGPKLQLCLLGLARIALFKPNQLVKGSIHFRAEKMGIYNLFTGVGWMLGASMLKRSRMLYVHFWNHQERNFKPHGKRVLESFTIIDPIINFPSNNFFSYDLYALLMILTNGNALSLKKSYNELLMRAINA
jgi:hypothetical protein